jgi:hypothetical protein
MTIQDGINTLGLAAFLYGKNIHRKKMLSIAYHVIFLERKKIQVDVPGHMSSFLRVLEVGRKIGMKNIVPFLNT